MRSMKIGFFDSGLGGLTILNSVRSLMPQYEYLYFGDTENLPYGDKTERAIQQLTTRAVTHLFEREAALVIVACNTASAETLPLLQTIFTSGVYTEKKVIGVIIPTIETIIDKGIRKPLLLGTRRTIDSGKYELELRKRSIDIDLVTLPTPSLVPLIESGQIQKAKREAEGIIHRYKGTIDSVILGCTHYTLLKEHLREVFMGTIEIISQDEIIPHKLQNYLERHSDIEKQISRSGKVDIELSRENRYYDSLKESLLRYVKVAENK